MQRIRVGLITGILGLVALVSPVLAENKQVVAGAGPSTEVVGMFFSDFCTKPCAVGYEFVVPPMSTKHAGGIKNTESFLFGRTGRPLNSEERSQNKREIFLAKVPIAFATGEGSRLSALSVEQVEKIYRGDIKKWSELGGDNIDIITVGREPTEAIYSELKEEYPFFAKASFDIIFKNDDEVVKFMQSSLGKYAIAFGAAPSLEKVKRLDIKGNFQAGVRLGLVYDQKNEEDPLVKAARGFAASDEWQQRVAKAGMYPVRSK